MRLLVTGGAGFIGSEFVRRTLGDHPEDSVTVLDKLTYAGNPLNLQAVADDPRYTFVHGDVTDIDTANDLAQSVDVIVNFAAETHVDKSLESPGEFITTDVYGTWVLMEAARGAKHERFVHVSTDEVYGDVAYGQSGEGDPLRPNSPYSASKAGAELQVWAYWRSFGFPALTTRGCNTYGPHQYPEKIVPLFILNAFEDRPLPIYGDGLAVRDYLHVSDHAAGIDVVLREGRVGHAYNIAAGLSITANAVADMVLEAAKKPTTLRETVRDRRGHDRRYSVTTDRIRELGWEPTIALEEGMRATVKWYRDNESWWSPLRDEAYWAYYERTYASKPNS